MKFLTLLICGLISLGSGIAVDKWHTSQDGSIFYIEPEQKFNWHSAWNECERKNMSLIAIDSHHKHLQIDSLLRPMFGDICKPLWISGNDMAIESRYEWATTGELFTFTNWATGQPNVAAEHYILIYTDYNWHDWTGDNRLGFICEENRYIKKYSTQLQEKSKELDMLKQKCPDKSIAISPYKNFVMFFSGNPNFEYLHNVEKSAETDNPNASLLIKSE